MGCQPSTCCASKKPFSHQISVQQQMLNLDQVLSATSDGKLRSSVNANTYDEAPPHKLHYPLPFVTY
jgi:hypothetical protein